MAEDRSSSDKAGGSGTSLESKRGTTTIDDVVVTKVAGIAAREVKGVHEIGGSTSRALGAVTDRMGVGDDRSRGVSVEVGEREAAVDLALVVEYGESIPNVARSVRDNIVKRVESLVGLNVVEVNIEVNDLYFPGDEHTEQEEPDRVR
ncbi:MAG: Asp23/Gls24 family envelope stress response protein [Solirubrobacterales bacterium]